MTDRIKGFVVTLEVDLREDDARLTLDAIMQIRGVLSVKPVKADIDDAMNQVRIRRELLSKLYKVMQDAVDKD